VIPYLILALFLLGVWGLIRKNNLIKKVIALSLVNSSLIILFVYLGSLSGSTAPIMIARAKGTAGVVDPLPQALTLTTIVIGICLTALALVLVARIYRHFGTLDIRRLDRAAPPDPSPEGQNDGDASDRGGGAGTGRAGSAGEAGGDAPGDGDPGKEGRP
jgi:multicomponent Na+:H+ antiporter subunit C